MPLALALTDSARRISLRTYDRLGIQRENDLRTTLETFSEEKAV